MAEPAQAKRARATKILVRLGKAYPDAGIELRFRTPLELLAATILSAQCTDERVNAVTATLFDGYRKAEDFARAHPPTLERGIHSTGFFKSKARSLIGMGRALVERHGGEVPRTRETLEQLPGVGRKTANVILNVAFGEPTIAVDTHIFRIANRTGIAPGKDVLAVEQKMLKFVPDEFRQHAHHWLILHGRYVCKARKPDCPACLINDWCEYRKKLTA